jgi:hypothetical protein
VKCEIVNEVKVIRQELVIEITVLGNHLYALACIACCHPVRHKATIISCHLRLFVETACLLNHPFSSYLFITEQ